MDEDVGAAAILGDEAEALLSVEPLDGSLSHAVLLARDVSETTPCGIRSAALIAPPPEWVRSFSIKLKNYKKPAVTCSAGFKYCKGNQTATEWNRSTQRRPRPGVTKATSGVCRVCVVGAR
ncbi:hypothetical protein GCM10020229_30760 [Kitasatospora albolonga]